MRQIINQLPTLPRGLGGLLIASSFAPWAKWCHLPACGRVAWVISFALPGLRSPAFTIQ